MHFVINNLRQDKILVCRGDLIATVEYFSHNTGLNPKMIKRDLQRTGYCIMGQLVLVDSDLDIRKVYVIDRPKIQDFLDYYKVEYRNVLIKNILR